MRLAEAQKQMAAAIMTPLARADRLARRPATHRGEAMLKPNRRMSSRERLEIYARSYWFRLLDSFRDDFPGLASVLGPARFERMARAYLTDTPSRSFTLRDLGSRLVEWLERYPAYGRMALDMARLEWAHIVAFDGPSAKPLEAPEIFALQPGSRVGLQPYIHLLELEYPVDEIRMKTRSRRAKPRPLFLAVHRADLNVHYRRMEAGEFRVLKALAAGKSIGRAVDGAPPDSLRLWFATWARLGWLTVRNAR